MSDFLDILKSAKDKGILLDSCGTDERQKWWGLYNDLCGMSVEDAMSVQYYHGEGGGGSKKKNTVTFVMQKGSDDEYSLLLSLSYAPTAPVNVTFSMNGETKNVIIPAGTQNYATGFKGATPDKPYAIIENITLSSEDESYTYTASNTVKTGVFTLTVTKDGVTTVDNVQYGTTVTLTEAPAREGYDFIYKDSEGTVITELSFPMPEKDLTIIGTYVVKTFVLTYTLNEEYLGEGDTLPVRVYSSGTIDVTYGDNVLSHISTSERNGFTLSNWTDGDGVVIDNNTTMPAKNLDITALYSLNEYTIQYFVDSVLYRDDTGYFGAAIPTVEDPSKIGYTFNRWSPAIPDTFPASDMAVNAVFDAIDYTITYYVDGVKDSEETHHYGDAIAIKREPSKEGYTFSGWDTVLPSTMPAENIVINGTFTINEYVLSYKVDGEIVFTASCEYNSVIVPIANPEKTGYSFVQWNPAVPATMPAHNVECVAEFEINQYQLNYKVDGVFYSSQTFDYNAVVVPIAEPTQEGYTFSGWNNVPERMPANDVEVNGEFTVNEYLLEYEVDGEVIFSASCEYNSVITPIENPEKVGYTFVQWNPAVPQRMPANNVLCVAEFEINQYQINYKIDGEFYSSQTFDYNAVIVPLEEPSQEGYTFSGWTYIPERMPAEDIEVEGEFIINTYTLDLFVDDELYSSLTFDYNEEILPILDPEKQGHTFSGWNPVIPQRMPAYDMSCSGHFTVNAYDITYTVKENGVVIYTNTESHNFGSNISIRAPFTKEGYTFSGWEPSVLPATMPDYDILVTGETVVNQYTMNFFIEDEEGSGATLYTSITANYGAAIAMPVPPAITGYTFSGWVPNVPATMPVDGGDYYGVYNINYHIATFKIEGTQHSQQNLAYGATINYPNVPREGYVLKWTPSGITTMPDMDVTFNGAYEEKQESTTLYYSMMLNDNVSGLTPAIVSGLSSYDGAEHKEQSVPANIPGSTQCQEWAVLRDEADEEGDVELFEYYQGLINDWAVAHQYAFVFAVPESVEFDALVDAAIGIPYVTEACGSMVIEDTNYELRRYTQATPPFRQTDTAKEYTLKIKLK